MKELDLNRVERQLRHQFGKASLPYQMFHNLLDFYRDNQGEQSSRCVAETARGSQCSYDAKYCDTHAKLKAKD